MWAECGSPPTRLSTASCVETSLTLLYICAHSQQTTPVYLWWWITLTRESISVLFAAPVSCPPIAFYDHEHLDRQLDQAAGAFINGGGVDYIAESNTLRLSKIFQWYLADFGGLPAVFELIQRHVIDQEVRSVLASGEFRVRYMEYDWKVNSSA